jgi:L-lysine exporter family protein LysE/ArgO
MDQLFAGFLLSLSLILVLGPQNAHVLRMGLLKQQVGITVAACAITDAILIGFGVAGLGRLLALSPVLEISFLVFGLLFLAVYGFSAARRAWRGEQQGLDGAASGAVMGATHAMSGKQALGLALGFSWLNPHAWLDTAVLIGTASAAYPAPANAWFGLGAALGSAVWFVALGFGARALAPWLATPKTWRIIDAVIALTMWGTAIWLGRSVFAKLGF